MFTKTGNDWVFSLWKKVNKKCVQFMDLGMSGYVCVYNNKNKFHCIPIMGGGKGRAAVVNSTCTWVYRFHVLSAKDPGLCVEFKFNELSYVLNITSTVVIRWGTCWWGGDNWSYIKVINYIHLIQAKGQTRIVFLVTRLKERRHVHVCVNAKR